MTTLKEMIAQKEALELQIKEATSKGRADAIEQVKALMQENGLKLSDLSTGRTTTAKPKSSGGAKVAAKYRNASTGESWSGRGLQPRWLKAALASGQKIADFAV